MDSLYKYSRCTKRKPPICHTRRISKSAMRRKNLILLVGLLVGICSTSLAQSSTVPPDAERKVLFVGNSYTYFWNLPHVVQGLAASSDIKISTKQSTAGGVNLGQHWRGDRKLQSKSLIQNGDFDIVVIQDHSMRSIQAPDSLMYYGKLFGDLIKSTGAQPYVYMTWSRRWDPYMIETIQKEYTRLAEKINARIVPVGLAWQRALELRPNLPIYDDDGSHQSSLGTYLNACVFYGIITGKSPVGLTNRLISKDHNGEKLYLTIQSNENALFCQKVAEEIINKYID